MLLRLFLRGVGQYSVGSLRDKRGRCLGLARVPERLPPPSLSPQLRRYLGLHILLFSGLRHVLSRDGDLRGTAEAPWVRLGIRQGKVWDASWRGLAGVGYFGPKIKFIGLFTGLSCIIFSLGSKIGRVRYHVYWSQRVSPHSHVGRHTLPIVLSGIYSIGGDPRQAPGIVDGKTRQLRKRKDMITKSGQGTET